LSYKAETEETVSLDKIVLLPEITQMLRGEPSKAVFKIEECLHDCSVCKHHSCNKIAPEIATQDSLVDEYYDKYQKGIEFPPLDVQKSTYKLLNGYHRYEALVQLRRKTVNVKVWQVDDKDLLYIAYRLNSTQGQKIHQYNRNQLIFNARVKDKKSLKEIADIFDLTQASISQILNSCELAEKFRNLSPEETKLLDWRKKTDKALVIADLEKGLSQIEIAHKYGYTEGRISQIKKERLREVANSHLMILEGEQRFPSIGLKHFEPPPDIMGFQFSKKPILVFAFESQEDADATYKALSHINVKVHKSLYGDSLLSLLYSAGLLSISSDTKA
jgi:transposase